MLEYGAPMPQTDILEGLYLDDHIVMAKVKRSEALIPTGRDVEVVKQSHACYEHFKWPRSEDKPFFLKLVFVAWGTAVQSHTGLVGTPPTKRLAIFILTCWGLSFKYSYVEVLRRLAALQAHPLQHAPVFIKYPTQNAQMVSEP